MRFKRLFMYELKLKINFVWNRRMEMAHYVKKPKKNY